MRGARVEIDMEYKADMATSSVVVTRKVEPKHSNAKKRKVLVYTYCKVSSVSLVTGLRHVGVTAAHLHNKDVAEQWLAGNYNSTRKDWQKKDIFADEDLALFAGDECFVITAVRSAFHHLPSLYFETVLQTKYPWGYRPHGPKTRYKDSPTAASWSEELIPRLANTNISILIEDFRAQLPLMIPWTTTWYSKEFYPVTGVDVFQSPFDLERKYMLFKGELCTVLLLRYEDVKSWDKTIGLFFPGFKLAKENFGKNKWYHAAYAKFKEALTYQPSEVDAICASETERHFYSGNLSRCQNVWTRSRRIARRPRPWFDPCVSLTKTTLDFTPMSIFVLSETVLLHCCSHYLFRDN